MYNNFQNISVIIPFNDSKDALRKALQSLIYQTLKPNEIVIVNSTQSDDSIEVINEFKNSIDIIDYHEDYAYPGKARNIGVSIANNEWIAFLDIQTTPDSVWLENVHKMTTECKYDCVLGLTRIDATNYFQRMLRAASYGRVDYPTIPGSIIKKDIFNTVGGFNDNVRAGEDIEWRERLKKQGLRVGIPEASLLNYKGLKNDIKSVIKKYFIAAYHTAHVDIQSNIKAIYFSIFILLFSIILIKWNYIIGFSEENMLFIPHITKIYLLCISIFLMFYHIINIFLKKIKINVTILNVLKIIFIILFSGLIFNWNRIFAKWVEDAVWYFPHISKIYVSFLFIVSVSFRGIIMPLKKKVQTNYLFPINWIFVGILGLILDLTKAPGYIYGGMLLLISKFGIGRNRKVFK